MKKITTMSSSDVLEIWYICLLGYYDIDVEFVSQHFSKNRLFLKYRPILEVFLKRSVIQTKVNFTDHWVITINTHLLFLLIPLKLGNDCKIVTCLSSLNLSHNAFKNLPYALLISYSSFILQFRSMHTNHLHHTL